MNQQHHPAEQQQTSNANTSTSSGPTNNLADNKKKTSICLVNELAQYNEIQHQYLRPGRQGPAHKNLYTVTLTLGNEQYRAEGSTTEKAQQSAAAMALQHTELKHPPLKRNDRSITPTVVLNALCMKHRETAVYIHENRGPAHQRYMPQPGPSRPHYRKPPSQPFFVRLHIGELEYPGMGRTKQAARHDAASKAIEYMEGKEMNDNQLCPVVNENALPPTGICNGRNTVLKSPISLVHEIARKRELKVTFHVLSEMGPPHMKVFIMQCCIGNLMAKGEGKNKRISKQRAAEKILQELKKLELLPNTTNKRESVVTKQKQHNSIKVNSDRNSDYLAEINPVSRLFQIQRANKGKAPVYHIIEERDGSKFLQFVVVASANGHYSVGVHRYKRIAEWNAAEALLSLLGYTNSHASQNMSKPVIEVEKETEQVKNPQNVIFMEKKGVNAAGGSKGGQLAPGLLLVNDREAFQKKKPILGRSEMLNSGSGSAPTEVKKTGHVQAANKSPQRMQSVQIKDQLKTLQGKVALEAANALLEFNAESVHGGSTAKPQVSPKAGLD